MASVTVSAASLSAVRAPRVSARRAAHNGVAVRTRAAIKPAAVRATAPVAALKEDAEERKMNPGFNMALAALVAGSVFVTDAVSPEWAEAARSSGRMGGSSFRSAPRAAPRAAAGQSRQAPPPQVMRGGMGYGYGMPMFMPFSPFGFSPFGFGFGFGGLGFIFNILLFLWIANFFINLVSSMTANNNQARDDDDFQPPRY